MCVPLSPASAPGWGSDCTTADGSRRGHSSDRQRTTIVPFRGGRFGPQASDHAILGDARLGALERVVLVPRLKLQVVFAVLKPAPQGGKKKKNSTTTPSGWRNIEKLVLPLRQQNRKNNNNKKNNHTCRRSLLYEPIVTGCLNHLGQTSPFGCSHAAFEAQ